MAHNVSWWDELQKTWARMELSSHSSLTEVKGQKNHVMYVQTSIE